MTFRGPCLPHVQRDGDKPEVMFVLLDQIKVFVGALVCVYSCILLFYCIWLLIIYFINV